MYLLMLCLNEPFFLGENCPLSLGLTREHTIRIVLRPMALAPVNLRNTIFYVFLQSVVLVG